MVGNMGSLGLANVKLKFTPSVVLLMRFLPKQMGQVWHIMITGVEKMGPLLLSLN